MIALSAKGLYKSFGNIHALSGINLDVVQGEFFGLLGPNGAGKTTFMRIVAGLLKADTGTVELLYSDQNKFPVLGVVPQDIALYDTLSARKNLEIFGSLLGLTGKQLSLRINHVLELVELQEQSDRAIKTFSGGMKRRINLAAGLLHDPQVVLLDEPTVGVDPQSRAKIFDLLKQLHVSGKTIIYTTHYMEEAERLCEKIGIIDHGKVLATGTLNDLLKQVNLPKYIRIITASPKQNWQSIKNAKFSAQANYIDCIPQNTEQLGSIVAELESEKFQYDRLEIVSPNLESLFLQLTGKELRDDE